MVNSCRVGELGEFGNLFHLGNSMLHDNSVMRTRWIEHFGGNRFLPDVFIPGNRVLRTQWSQLIGAFVPP